jgi:hypothetical protein
MQNLGTPRRGYECNNLRSRMVCHPTFDHKDHITIVFGDTLREVFDRNLPCCSQQAVTYSTCFVCLGEELSHVVTTQYKNEHNIDVDRQRTTNSTTFDHGRSTGRLLITLIAYVYVCTMYTDNQGEIV